MTCDICKDDQFPSLEMVCVSCAKKMKDALVLEESGRAQDLRERGLPHAWEHKKNSKRYGLVETHVMFGKVMVWLYEAGTNKALHLPLKSLDRFYPLNAKLERYP